MPKNVTVERWGVQCVNGNGNEKNNNNNTSQNNS